VIPQGKDAAPRDDLALALVASAVALPRRKAGKEGLPGGPSGAIMKVQ
jgi:hypothetical protein